MADKPDKVLGDTHLHVTKVSGYVKTPIMKACGTCEYLTDDRFCNQKTVQKDDELETDEDTGLKVVDPVEGCCDFWDPGE